MSTFTTSITRAGLSHEILPYFNPIAAYIYKDKVRALEMREKEIRRRQEELDRSKGRFFRCSIGECDPQTLSEGPMALLTSAGIFLIYFVENLINVLSV